MELCEHIETVILENNVEKLKKFISNQDEEKKKKVLWQAINFNSSKFVRILLESGVKPTGETWMVASALQQACDCICFESGDKDAERILKLLLTHHTFTQEELDKALYFLNEEDEGTKKEKILLKTGANPNAKVAKKVTKLIQQNPESQEIQALLKSAQLACKAWEKTLLNACCENHKCALTLLQMGFTPHPEEADFCYRSAISKKNKKLAEVLRRAGAPTDGANEEEAILAALQNDQDMVQFHLGMCPNPKFSASYVLLRCVHQIPKEMVQLLVKKEGADILGTQLTSPLSKALSAGNHEAIDALLDLGAKPTQENATRIIAEAASHCDPQTLERIYQSYQDTLTPSERNMAVLLANNMRFLYPQNKKWLENLPTKES